MVQDTNGIVITQQPDANGSTTPQHAASLHKGYFLNDKAKVSEIDGIRGLLIHEKPGVVSFLAGKPNPHTFPFDAITLNIKPPLGSSSTTHTTVEIKGEELATALQYGPTPGLVAFREWLSDFQSTVHKRPLGEWSVNVGTGSQDLMAKAFAVVLNPGDPVLIETPVYAGILPPLRNLQAKTIEVEVDEQGISPADLEKTLANWPTDQRRPKVVYVNPVGCNPSGCSHSKERKLAVLEVCKKYNLLILEGKLRRPSRMIRTVCLSALSQHELMSDFLAQTTIPSYFELETQVFPSGGHVVRFDSFSKLLAAGMRLGFASGPKEILHAIDVVTAGQFLHPSSVAQAVAYGLVKHWGIQGFRNHAQHVADFYAERRKRFEALAHKHLDGLASWVSPVAGMFLWMDLSPAGVEDSFSLIREEALAKGVLAVPGFAFFPNGRKSSHVRTSFSLVDLDTEAELGMQRLAEAIKDWQQRNGKA